MKNNNFEEIFNKNLSNIIQKQIEKLSKHSEVIKEFIKDNINSNKLNDDVILNEIWDFFGDDSFSERTFKNIKLGYTSSSTFNVFLIIYILNDLSEQVNRIYRENGYLAPIELINIELLMEPLKA